MNLSEPHPERPHELTGVKLGDRQFVRDEERRNRGLLALVGIGVEPGLSDAFARYASDELFSELDEVGVRDAAIHRRPEDTAQAGSRFDAADRGAGSRGGAARRGCGRPARSRDARQPHARADVRRHLHRGHRHRWAAPTDVPLPRPRQRARHAGVGAPGGRPADRAESGSCARAARDGEWYGVGVLGPEAFPPGRSSTCSASTARRTGSRIVRFPDVRRPLSSSDARA